MKDDGLKFFVRSGRLFLVKGKNGTIRTKELWDGEKLFLFPLHPRVPNLPCPVLVSLTCILATLLYSIVFTSLLRLTDSFRFSGTTQVRRIVKSAEAAIGLYNSCG